MNTCSNCKFFRRYYYSKWGRGYVKINCGTASNHAKISQVANARLHESWEPGDLEKGTGQFKRYPPFGYAAF